MFKRANTGWYSGGVCATEGLPGPSMVLEKFGDGDPPVEPDKGYGPEWIFKHEVTGQRFCYYTRCGIPRIGGAGDPKEFIAWLNNQVS